MILSLRRITVENFRAVRGRISMDFTATPSGLYYVRGDNLQDSRLGSNGAGKSTLMVEALIWAMTGRVSRSQRPSSDVESRGTSGATKVEVEFAVDGEICAIARSRNPNNLTLNGSKVDQEDLDKFLPLPDAALRKSVVIDQFADMFMSLRPEAKSQLFTETLDLDVWLRAADAASDRAAAEDRALRAAERDLSSTRGSLQEVQEQLEQALAAEAEFEKNQKELIKAAKVASRSAKAAASSARTALDDARRALDKVGASDRDVRALNDQKTELRKLERAAADLSAKSVSAERDASSAERQLAAYRGKTCPECGQVVSAEHVAERRAELERKLVGLRKTISVTSSASLETAGIIKELEDSVADLERRLTKDTQAQADVSVKAERSLAADRQARAAEAELARLVEQKNPHEEQCDRLDGRAKELRAEVSKLEASAAEAEASIAIYKFWQQGFREIRLSLIDEALLELEITACRHAESLGLEGWRVEFATERETKKGSVSHGFTVLLYSPDSDEPVSWETYSGGEAQRWQLAITFGLAEVLLARAGVQPDFEIIDEPTAHMSPEGIEDLLACLSDRAREQDRRIFLIDHNSLDRGVFDGVVTIAKDAKRGTYVADTGGVLRLAEAAASSRVRL